MRLSFSSCGGSSRAVFRPQGPSLQGPRSRRSSHGGAPLPPGPLSADPWGPHVPPFQWVDSHAKSAVHVHAVPRLPAPEGRIAVWQLWRCVPGTEQGLLLTLVASLTHGSVHPVPSGARAEGLPEARGHGGDVPPETGQPEEAGGQADAARAARGPPARGAHEITLPLSRCVLPLSFRAVAGPCEQSVTGTRPVCAVR